MARPNYQLRAAATTICRRGHGGVMCGGDRDLDRCPPLAITGVRAVIAGETCGSVARDARLTLPQFVDLNQNVTCGALFPDQWLWVRGAAVG